MKIENTNYVIMRVGQIDIGRETEYLCYDSETEFTNDITKASRFADRKAAQYAKCEFCVNKNNGYELDMQIIPVKITYEW